ncbi:hypothetical protein KW800_02670 [Candidatus Parcubacteria bacterium]|nr:hypothetical protein [Candidatus Parcubacteria bacterium]
MRKTEFDKPLWIAAHFGFTPIEAPIVGDLDLRMTADCEENTKSFCNAPEKAAFLRTYLEKKYSDLPHPLALSWRKARDYSLELIGYPTGVAEAKLIRTSLSILSEDHKEGMTVEINSIGDKDSVASYERELHNFVRKIAGNLSAEMKKLFKEDIFAVAKVKDEVVKGAPQSISFLSGGSRERFKDVLEYLEALGVEYRFAPDLVGVKNLCSETLFAIRDSEGRLLAAGYHYSRLGKRFGIKKEVSLIGATIYGEKKPKDPTAKIYKEAPKPKFYLLHLGREARMKALSLIELLRENKVPIYHFLGREKLGAQMELADKLRTPYLMIVGQKEALDHTVTIRNVASRAQETVPFATLPQYLKHLPF